MGTLTKYLLRQTATSAALVTIVLALVIWLTQSLRSMDLVVSYGVGLTTLLHLVLLLLPDIIGIILPLCVFIGLIVVFNRLQHDHEIIVMRSLGMSPWQISKPILAVAAFASLFLYFVSFYLLPISFQEFRSLQVSYKHQYKSALLQEGEFINFNKVTVFVNKKSADGEIQGIFIYDGRVVENPVILTAERGYIFDTESGPRLVLQNGTRQAKDGKNPNLSLLRFEEYVHDLKKPNTPNSMPQKKPSECFIWELFNTDPVASPEYTHRLRIEGHQRILSPLFPIIFVLMGLLYLLQASFHRVHRIMPFMWSTLSVTTFYVVFIAVLQSSYRWPFLINVAYVVVLGSTGGMLLQLRRLSSVPRKQHKGQT